MSRPLLISDCDDVLLHFAPHFADYVAEAHGYTFRLGRPGFVGALTDETGADVGPARAWELLNLFFDAEMHRQHLVDGALAALRTIGAEADIVILTNIGDQHSANRVVQLERLDIRHRVICNQGGKGRPVAELLAEMKAVLVMLLLPLRSAGSGSRAGPRPTRRSGHGRTARAG